jgi:hypothetical protein
MQTSWTVIGDGQRAVGGGGGDPDAGAELEVRGIRQREGAFGRDEGVILGGAAGWAAVASERDPDALADAEPFDAGAELVDDSGAVVVRDRRSPPSAETRRQCSLPLPALTMSSTTRSQTPPLRSSTSHLTAST